MHREIDVLLNSVISLPLHGSQDDRLFQRLCQSRRECL